MNKWKPHKLNEYWVCYFQVDTTKCVPPINPYFNGSDGTPLQFYSEKAAQIKCDALNKKEVML